LGLLARKPGPKSVDRFSLASASHPKHDAGVEIGDDREVPMALLDRFLVDTDMAHQTRLLTAATALDCTQHDRVHLIPSDRHAPCYRRDRHLAQ